MGELHVSRRAFLKAASAATAVSVGAGTGVVGACAEAASHSKPKSKNDRPRIGCIGLRYQGTVIAEKARAHGDIVALCDVDTNVREQARASFGSTPKIFEDYRAAGVNLQYQKYELKQPKPLLREMLDKDFDSERHRKFRANRSLRDVEPE